MAISIHSTQRSRRTPVESTEAERERLRLRHENRKRIRDAEYSVAYQQFWARR